jgi:hypothetical protein
VPNEDCNWVFECGYRLVMLEQDFGDNNSAEQKMSDSGFEKSGSVYKRQINESVVAK